MARSPRLGWHGRLVLLLGALSAFGPLSMDMYLPGLPSMARDLSAPAWAAQLTITTSMLGLAGGQLVAGPISDALGRRRPVLAGVAAYMAASLLCAAAPTIWLLLVFRLVQGMAGAAGIVIARAIVRDLHEGIEAARMFAMLMLIGGLAPILAPLVGGELLHVTDWRGIFVVLAGIGALLLLGAWAILRETLAPENRRGGGLVATLHVFRGLVRDRPFMGYALSAGLTFAAMATYISGSPFVLQDIHGVSPQLFSVIFASNAIGIMGASQVSRALVGRYGPRAMLEAGVCIGAAGGLGVLVSVVAELGLAAPAPQPLRDGVERRRGAAQRGRARPGRPPDHRRQRVGAARPDAVRHRRPGRAAGRGRRLAHRAADGDRHGHAAPRRPGVPEVAGRPIRPAAGAARRDRSRSAARVTTGRRERKV